MAVDDKVGMRCKVVVGLPTHVFLKIVKHANSAMHRGAVVAEAEVSSACAFQNAVTMEMKAAIGCCKCIYWLCKNEISHITTYP